jgi:hypothetical protein
MLKALCPTGGGGEIAEFVKPKMHLILVPHHTSIHWPSVIMLLVTDGSKFSLFTWEDKVRGMTL